AAAPRASRRDAVGWGGSGQGRGGAAPGSRARGRPGRRGEGRMTYSRRRESRLGERWTLLVILTVAAWLGATRPARAADPVAVLTEIRAGPGEVRVKRAEAADWTAPQPLLALRPGDQVRVPQDGRAVVTFTGGGVRTVTAQTSPLTVEAPRGQSASERVKGLLGGVTQFLLGQQKEPTY